MEGFFGFTVMAAVSAVCSSVRKAIEKMFSNNLKQEKSCKSRFWFFSRNGAAVISLDGLLVEQSSCKLLVNCNMALSIILIYMHV